MAENIFEKVAQGLPVSIGASDTQAARNWFREQALKLRNFGMSKLFEQNQNNVVRDINITSIGSMFTYYYDPKWKDKLPYYDQHPLVIVTDVHVDGWSGLNMHYLPPLMRARLMDALYGITLKEKDMQKIQVSYNVLKSASRFNLFKPCYKRYLTNHVQSRIIFIEPKQWDMVLMLPLQKFVKADEETVWKDSVNG